MLIRDASGLDAEALLAPCATAPAILLGVSGGPDSMALMALAAGWSQSPGRPRVEIATVDHGLRPGSRAEAEIVGRVANARGLRHAILDWTGDKPVTRLQERARDARYALLVAHAKSIGATMLLTAHHGDDQAETILFRLLRGSGVVGLAGMAAHATRGDLDHARPLLGVAKSALVAYCDREGLDYVRDPSNADPRFARSGLRELGEILAARGLGTEELLRVGARAARASEALAWGEREFLRRVGGERRDNVFVAWLGLDADAPVEFVTRLLLGETALLHPAGRRPRLDRAESLARKLLGAARSGAALAGTLGGTRVVLDREGQLTIRPEAARKASIKPVHVHFDRNFSDPLRDSAAASLGKPLHDA